MLTTRRLCVAAAAITLLVTTAGCGQDKPADTAPTAAPTVSATPTPTTSATNIPDTAPTAAAPTGAASDEPTPGETDPGYGLKGAPKEVVRAAAKYLDARENQVSWYQKRDASWLTVLKSTMTAKGYNAIAEQVKAGAGGSNYAWDTSHDEGLAVKTFVGCEVSEAAGVDTATEKIVLCSLVDQVVGKDGKPVPLNDIPDTWPYIGQQTSPQLEIHKVGGRWLVDHDYTGEAS